MATSLEDINIAEDVTLCSVCFEKFKNPRYLPCSHSFCHSCLSSYIVSICTSTEPRLGFHCPLCREYIHCQGTFDKPEDIVNVFPENYLLEKILEKVDQLNCESCLRDNEEEEATAFCATCMENLCQVCSKCHKKGLVTKSHKVYQLSEIKSSNILSESVSNLTCTKHKNREIELFCNDHEALCCTMCVSTEHRKCESVDTADVASESLKGSGKLSGLLNEVRNMERKLTSSKARQEKNITEIEDSVDSMTEKTESEMKILVEHLEKLKNDLLKEISVAGKTSKEQISKSLDIVTDGISCAKSCGDEIERVMEKGSDVEILMKYCSAMATLEQMKCFQFKERCINISLQNKSKPLKEIKDLESLSNIETFNTDYDVFPVYKKELSFKKDFKTSCVNIRSGCFLSNHTFFVANFKSDGMCFVYNDDFTCIKKITELQHPFAAVECGNELFISCKGTRSIEVFSCPDYAAIRTIDIGMKVYGITCNNDILHVACGDKIITLDKAGIKLKEYKTGPRVVHLLVSNGSNIVYSNKNADTVIAMNKEGHTLWEYKASNLKQPYGLEKDSAENILVAGTESKNIHVLSSTGELIREFDCVQKPVFLAMNEERRICYVCSEYKNIQVYEVI